MRPTIRAIHWRASGAYPISCTKRGGDCNLKSADSRRRAGSMLLLVFQAGGQRFGLDTSEVIEVVPVLACRKLPHAPSYIAGLANYRGTAAPVIDVSALLTGEGAPLLL